MNKSCRPFQVPQGSQEIIFRAWNVPNFFIDFPEHFFSDFFFCFSFFFSKKKLIENGCFLFATTTLEYTAVGLELPLAVLPL